jgi:hypothetical protein
MEAGMVTSKRLNLVREHQHEYAGGPTPRLIQVSAASYLAIDGNETRDRSDALGALLAVARRIRKSKRHAGHDFALAPLEDLLWPGLPPGKAERWTLLLRVPPSVQARDVLRARRELGHHREAAVATPIRRHVRRRARGIPRSWKGWVQGT